MSYASNLTQHDPDIYAKNASFNWSDANTAPVLSLLNAQPGERILDIGCGSGALTEKLSPLVGKVGEIWGTDSNQKMLDAAKSKYPHLASRLFQADIQDLILAPEAEHYFDAIFTSATLHWCKRDPAGVVAGAKRALKKPQVGKPAPRFVGEFGGYMNCVGVRSHLYQVLTEAGEDPSKLDPWYFPTAEEYAKVLEDGGFKVEHISLNPRMTQTDGDLYGWLYTFARSSWLADMDESSAQAIMKKVVERCESDHRTKDGRWSLIPQRRQR